MISIKTGLATAALLLCSSAVQAGFAVDGSLVDWGFTASLSTSLPNNSIGSAAGDGFTFDYMREDSSDSAGDSGPLGPNQGGQNYDGEFMGVARTTTNLMIAIVTGQRPDNGFSRYAPGDIRIVLSNGAIYGIEVGGGSGDSSTTKGAITQGARGATYAVDSDGFTTDHDSSPSSGPGSNHTAGAVFLTTAANWILDPIVGGTPPFDGKQPVQLQFTGGTLVGTADYIYTRDSVTTQKAVIELSLSLSLFGGLGITSVQWAPACGNDVLFVAPTNQTSNVPEPATMVLGLLGMAGLAGVRRFRRNEN